MKFLSKKILISITGKEPADWKNKLREIEKYKIKKIALFLEFYNKKQRKEIYEKLLSSNIKKIPFVHARHDMSKDEFEFLIKNFKTKYFNIHIESFTKLREWNGLHKKLLLELAYTNKNLKNIYINKIKGFCIDLSHFKASEDRWTTEFEYITKQSKIKKYFVANHLNGYSTHAKKDLHTIKSLKEFDYLKTLPKFLFGKYIALEVFNPIKDQLRFKKYLCKILRNK